MALHRYSQLLAALTLLSIISWLGWGFRRSDNVQIQPVTPQREYKDESQSRPHGESKKILNQVTLDNLCQQYGVCNISPDASIVYGRIDVDVIEDPSFEVPLLQNIDVALPTLEPLDNANTIDKPNKSPQRVIVKTPSRPPPIDASNFLFGVATNIDRLEDSLSQFSHWASDNGARIVALVPNTSLSEHIDRTLEKSRDLKVNLTILTSELGFNDRYFNLASLMYDHSTPSTTWTTFIDDDTFFPSINSLQDMLSKYPSPRDRPYYIGALSEDMHQLFKWGMMAYGGGGIFLSFALLAQLVPHLPGCAQLAHTGDVQVAQCIFSHTITKLTPEPQLHQIDLFGDVSGFYEALRPQPVSVHHWKSWNHFDMVKIARVSSVCGDACIFQKYRFTDGWQMTNGFSIVKYSEGNERGETDQRMEQTFKDSEGGSLDMFLHSVAPLRPKDEGKLQYILEGSVGEGGAVRQFYVRRTTERINGEEGTDRPVVQVVEVAWSSDRKKNA